MKRAITFAILALAVAAQAATWQEMETKYSWYTPISKNVNGGNYEITLQTRDKGGAVKNLTLNVENGEITNPEVFSQLSSTVGLLAQDVAAIAAELTKTVTKANNMDEALRLLRAELDAVFADIYAKIKELEINVTDVAGVEPVQKITYEIKNVTENKTVYESKNFYAVAAKAVEGDGKSVSHEDTDKGKRKLSVKGFAGADDFTLPLKGADGNVDWQPIGWFGDGEGIEGGDGLSIKIKGWNASPLPCDQDIANLMTNTSAHATSERLKHRVLARYASGGTNTMHYLDIGQLVSLATQQSGPWRFDEGQQRFKDTLIQVGTSTVTLGDQQAPGIGTIYCVVTIANDGTFSSADLSTSPTHEGKVVFAVGSLTGSAGGYKATWTRNSIPCIAVYQ